MKMYLIELNSSKFVTDNPHEALALFNLQGVEDHYIDGDYIYTLTDVSVRVKSINSDLIRSVTKKEQENKELSSANDKARWATESKVALEKEVADLKCQLKVVLKNLKDEQPEVPEEAPL